MRAWGGLKTSYHRYLSGGGGLIMFLVKKDFCKIKYGFEGWISSSSRPAVAKLPINV